MPKSYSTTSNVDAYGDQLYMEVELKERVILALTL